jgi:hypothetical protein
MENLLNGMSDMNLAIELVERMNAEKEKIILKKLDDLSIPFVLEEEQGRRFKRFVREIKGDEETIYFNNGTPEGLRVVTFITKQTPFDAVNFSYGLTIRYY